MRLVIFLFAVLLWPAASAFAQVTIDLHALDALPGAKPPSRPPAPRPVVRRPQASAKPTTPSVEEHATATPSAPPPQTSDAPAQTPPASTATPPAATLPTGTPPTASLSPVPPPQEATPPAPPPPPPISDTATTAVAATGDGLRVTFGSGEADLNPKSAAEIQNLVNKAPKTETVSFNVIAYAAGAPDDPSTARRLSLSRALAVRSALIADGVSSARIYVRALGAAGGDGPPDRVDLTVLGSNLPQTSSSGQAQSQQQ